MYNLKEWVDNFQSSIKNDVTNIWNNATFYASIRLMEMNGDEYFVGYLEKPKKVKGKLESSGVKGVYIWKHKDTILYVGKTDAPTTDINKRQKSHINSFEQPWSGTESSGRKYREYMKRHEIDYMDVDIYYIDTGDADVKGTAEMIESVSVSLFQPEINSAISGNGKRTMKKYVDKRV